MKKHILAFVFMLGAVLFLSCQKAHTENADITEASSVPETDCMTTEISEIGDEHPTLIAHAGGAVYGYRLTNSLEALDCAYENGFRVFELDFEVTSDGEYVLIHDWESMADRMLFREGKQTFQEFKSGDTFASLTLLSLHDLLHWLAEHGDCRIVTDAKCGNDPFLSELYNTADVLSDRFIPQVYTYDEYAMAKNIGFERVILTLYRMTVVEDELVDFARKEKPWAITIPKNGITEKLVSRLAGSGVVTYAHTINDLFLYEEWSEWGLYGIYTDYFSPKKWVY